jgi:hypothetical protein
LLRNTLTINRFLNNQSPSQAFARVAALGLLAGAALSWPLWDCSARAAYPTLPLWAAAAECHSAWSAGLAILAMLLAAATALFPAPKGLSVALLAVILWLCALDSNRLQPWVWFYLLVLGVFLLEKKGEVGAFRWLLAGVYFWSGAGKTTPYFAEDNFAWFCEAFDWLRPVGQIAALGYAVAAFEAVVGLGLFFAKTQRFATRAAIVFHALIVVFLLRLDWNLVVIPWNFAMAAMCWLLLQSPENECFKLKKTTPAIAIALTLGWTVPLLYPIGAWPHTLSWQLYSNTQPEVIFYYLGEANFSKPAIQRAWEKHAFGAGRRLLLDDWANDALRVPMFYSERNFRQMGKYLCGCTQQPDSAGIQILTVRPWKKNAEKVIEIPCRELLAE